MYIHKIVSNLELNSFLSLKKIGKMAKYINKKPDTFPLWSGDTYGISSSNQFFKNSVIEYQA